MMRFTQKVKGGKLNVSERPRYMKKFSVLCSQVASSYQIILSGCALAFRRRNDCKASVAFCVQRPHGENYIILRDGERGAGYIAHIFCVFPIGISSRAP